MEKTINPRLAVYLLTLALLHGFAGHAMARASDDKVLTPIMQLLLGPPDPAPRSYVLNDTGITWGGNYPSGNNATCTGLAIDAQDCSHGRDVTHNDPTDGHAGFSFTKVANNGAELPACASLGNGPNDWGCSRDNVTGLIWEVKTTNGGLRDSNHSYTWYNCPPTVAV